MSVAGAILRRTEAMNQLPPLPQRGRGAGGEGCPHHPPSPLPLPHGERKGEMSVAGAILRLSTLLRSRTSSPLSRAAGEGSGVRAALTFPPAPLPLPRCGRGGGDACRVGQVFPVTARLGAG